MKAAKLTEHPNFRLMRQTDVQNVWHMQMPRWLFSDPRYADMSLDAKVTYTFLLNRFQLSRRNGWVNDAGEVFVIFPRKALAKELRICERSPRTPKSPPLEPQILMFQNRRIRVQVILILVNLIPVSQMSVCLYPRRMGRRTMKKSSRAFWMLVSFRISSRRWRVFLKMPSSGFSTRTICASGRPFCQEAGYVRGCIC